MDFAIPIAATGNHMSLLPEVRETILFTDRNQFHKFLRNAGFYPTVRNPVVQGEFTSGYLDSPRDPTVLETKLLSLRELPVTAPLKWKRLLQDGKALADSLETTQPGQRLRPWLTESGDNTVWSTLKAAGT